MPCPFLACSLGPLFSHYFLTSLTIFCDTYWGSECIIGCDDSTFWSKKVFHVTDNTEQVNTECLSGHAVRTSGISWWENLIQVGYVWATPKVPRAFGALTLSMSMNYPCWHGLFECLKRVVASQLSLSCHRTPVPYLFSPRAVLTLLPLLFPFITELFPPQSHPGPSSWFLTLLQAQHLALRFLCPSFAFSASRGVNCCHTKPHCSRHLLGPFSSVPLMSLQQKLCISFWQGFKNTAKRNL